MNKQIVFLDRDGTIIKDKSYMYKVEDLEFIDNSIEGLKMLQRTHELVIVTNQSGINRGKFGYKEYSEFNENFLKKLEEKVIEYEPDIVHAHDLEVLDVAINVKNKFIDFVIANYDSNKSLAKGFI